MKIHRFITQYEEIAKSVSITDKDLVHQISRVLRLQNGEHVILGDGKGNEIEAVLEEVEKNKVTAKILSRRKNINESDKNVTLYLALLKRDNFELAVQKAVEVGVNKIVPIITKRTVKTGLNLDRIKTIIREASEQSGRGIVPELSNSMNLKEALENCNGKESIIFDLSGSSIKEVNLKSKNINLFIGPEGGFADTEVELAKKNSLHIASLGPLTLRGETAAIVASYLLAH